MKFLLRMVKDDYIRGKDLEKFACPATDDLTSLPGDDTPGSGLSNWDEIDTDSKVWRVPMEKSKNGEPMIIALPDEALNVLADRKAGIAAEWACGL